MEDPCRFGPAQHSMARSSCETPAVGGRRRGCAWVLDEIHTIPDDFAQNGLDPLPHSDSPTETSDKIRAGRLGRERQDSAQFSEIFVAISQQLTTRASEFL
jgi:hypothetical protein